MNSPQPSIRDVARIAGVSTSTVSHVVNGTRPVSAERRAKVLQAIATTNYRQSAPARSLRRSRTDTVGLIITDTGNQVFSEMVHGIESQAREAGYSLLLMNTGEDVERERKAAETLLERRVDGIVLGQVSGSGTEFTDWLKAEVPLVLIDRLSASEVDQVGLKVEEPMRKLVGHLVDRGFRDIALLAGDTNVPTLAERRDGFVKALREREIDVPAERIIAHDGVTTRAVSSALMRTLLSGPGRPEAIVNAGPYEGAVGILEAAERAGLGIPGDLALVTFDDVPYADVFSPRLTALAQPGYEMGQEAMRLLLRRRKQAGAASTVVRLNPEFRHRESCGCPPGSPDPFR